MLKVIYAFFLGILLSIFVGAGISAFYQEPAAPKAPDYSLYGKDGPTTQQQAEEKSFQAAMDKYNKDKLRPYNRNVSIMSLAAAVTFVAIGLLIPKHINILADGLLLGGVFTLFYSLGRGFASQDNKYSFLAVSAGLVVALALGYTRFILPQSRKL